jgi:hypothetical protein
MSLEQALAANTAALEALTAAMSKAGVTAATTTTTGTKGKDKPAAYEAKHTLEEMQAAMNDVKEKCGKDKAIEIRNNVGKVAKLADVKDAKVIDDLYEAAKAALKEAEEAM